MRPSCIPLMVCAYAYACALPRRTTSACAVSSAPSWPPSADPLRRLRPFKLNLGEGRGCVCVYARARERVEQSCE